MAFFTIQNNFSRKKFPIFGQYFVSTLGMMLSKVTLFTGNPIQVILRFVDQIHSLRSKSSEFSPLVTMYTDLGQSAIEAFRTILRPP